MVFFELYTVKPQLKHKGGETSRIFYTNSSRMIIVIIVCITNGSSIDTLPGCSQSLCCLLQIITNEYFKDDTNPVAKKLITNNHIAISRTTLNNCERYNALCKYILNKLCYKVVRTNFNDKYGQFLFTSRFHTYAFPFGLLIHQNK